MTAAPVGAWWGHVRDMLTPEEGAALEAAWPHITTDVARLVAVAFQAGRRYEARATLERVEASVDAQTHGQPPLANDGEWPELLFREGEPSAIIREAAFQTNLARALADPACPFCTAEMVDGTCPACGHDPSTRGEPSTVSTGTPAGGAAAHPVYSLGEIPASGWTWWRKRTATRMVQIGGPCTIMTAGGSVQLPPGWRGYLAVDEDGHPYPIDDSVHRASYDPAGEPA